ARAEQEPRAGAELGEEVELARAFDRRVPRDVRHERHRIGRLRGEDPEAGGKGRGDPLHRASAESSGRSVRSLARRAQRSCASCVAPTSWRYMAKSTWSEKSAFSAGRRFSTPFIVSAESVRNLPVPISCPALATTHAYSVSGLSFVGRR